MVEESQSTVSSIDDWLDRQPDLTEDYMFKWPMVNKRGASEQPDSQRRHKRQQLMEVSGNAAKSAGQRSGRKSQSSNKAPPPATPSPERHSTRMHRRLPGTVPPIVGLDPFEEEDPNQTPTPRSNLPAPIPSLHPRPPNLPIKAPPSRGEASDSVESRGSKKSRSQSPTKRLGDFQLSDMPVDSRDWEDENVIPTELENFVKDMEQIGDRIGIIPSAVRAKLETIGRPVRGFYFVEDGGNDGGKKADTKAADNGTGGLGHDLFWHHVSRIHRASKQCKVGSASEPAWNSEVHSAVLRLALEGYWEEKEIWYQDISVARISNKSLVPWNVATGAMQSKMVDYAIVINPNQDFIGDASKSLHNHIIEKLRSESGATSINQTTAEWVRFKPIGVNIETKKGAVGEDEAHVQLGTWITAQYARLRQLVMPNATGRLPSFPVLSVQGQRWLLMVACMRENGRINLIKELQVGDTGSVAGVYQVIAAIRRIAEWISDDYRPWFEREVLGQASGLGASP